jgi:predicted secreted hydrolase
MKSRPEQRLAASGWRLVGRGWLAGDGWRLVGRGGRLAFVLVFAALALATADAQAPWREAAPGYTFAFPRDHASHPEFKIEWWYYTGNVATATGRRFGYQLTFFRVGVDQTPVNPSRWAIRDIHMAHLAVSDPQGRRYRFDERLSRSGPGLSGAATDRYAVWNDDWRAGLNEQGQHTLTAASPQAAITLVLDPGKPPAVNGIDGISQKGARQGNASHYYSMTRMPTRGTLVVDGERFEVTGDSWMDHEFGTSFLEPEQQGWDWLSIQLDDNRELMLYQLRRSDGTRDPRSSGTIVDAQGRTTHLTATDFTMTALGRTYTAPSGARYPLGWSVAIPSQQIAIETSTPLDAQELATLGAGIAYWEGMIEVRGTARGRPLTGRGYLEMTGYKGSLGRVMSLTPGR